MTSIAAARRYGGAFRGCPSRRLLRSDRGRPASTPRATAGLVIPSPVVPPAPIAAAPIEKIPLPSRAAVPPALAAPSVPSANSNGQFSIARQLGLGVSRIVIDAGHGGHDPGAHGNGINEADLVLDVAHEASKAPHRTGRRRRRDDARHRRLHPARGAHGDRQPRIGGPVPVDPRQCQPQHKGARDRDLLPQLRLESGSRGGGRTRELRLPARRCTACRRSCGRSR